MPADLRVETVRARVRAVPLAWIIMGAHAAFVASAHVDTRGLPVLGAYCGALGAFIAAIAMSVAWYARGPSPGVRSWHGFVVAWGLALVGAALGAGAGLAAGTAPLDVDVLVASFVVPACAALITGRLVWPLLAWLASLSSGPASGRALAVLAVAAAIASGAFGAVHPFVRFPVDPPQGNGALGYAIVGCTVTAVLLPIAGARLFSSWLAAGCAVTGVERRWPLALVAFSVVMLVMLADRSGTWARSDWAIYRAIAGALLGGAGAVAGALAVKR